MIRLRTPSDMAELRLRKANFTCPCCGFPTLSEQARYDICLLCWWEDDGQGDADADEIRGGPNGDLSLSAARRNFLDHLTMYEAGMDTRLGGADSAVEVRAKRVIISAYTELSDRPADPARLWDVIEEHERVLQAESDRKLCNAGS